jgi:hypothetical protein
VVDQIIKSIEFIKTISRTLVFESYKNDGIIEVKAYKTTLFFLFDPLLIYERKENK